MTPFNKPFLTGKELDFIKDAAKNGKLSGNGKYTQLCHSFFEQEYKFRKCLLTTSCTDALEMAAILCNIQPEDEIIVPSFTFVSSALAFVRQGAKIVFADSRKDNPCIDEDSLEALITPKTKAIVCVHYAGVAVNMDKIMTLASKYNLFVIEDAAQAIDSYYTGKDGVRKALGGIGHFGCFSFHETKNIHCGEGGMLVINDERFVRRAEIIWEKGTNRAEFFRGEINKYGWVDTGSSFLPSDILAAFLFAQLKSIDEIQRKRREIWQLYNEKLMPLADVGLLKTPLIPEYASNNAHMYYVVCKSILQRQTIIDKLKENSVMAVFHYQSLHSSEYYKTKHDNRVLQHSDMYSVCLLRLPFFVELQKQEIFRIVDLIKEILYK